jgi:hypothetical protein
MPEQCSVILCAHNPRMDFLERALAALRKQSLAVDNWELLIVDNCSSPALSGKVDLSWHPKGKVVREERLGLTAARLKGIAEASSALLVFVDDDNVLAEDYIEQAARIGKEWLFLGAWGGSILPWFEVEPCAKARWCLPHLTLREVRERRWSNFKDRWDCLPWGAGLCVRADVAEKWAAGVRAVKTRFELGRRGDSLLSQEDTDLALTACDAGLGTGLFPELRLTHLIPARRLEPAYLRKLAESIAYSMTMLQAVRGMPLVPPTIPNRLRKSLAAVRQGLWPLHLHLAAERGRLAALRDWANKSTSSQQN